MICTIKQSGCVLWSVDQRKGGKRKRDTPSHLHLEWSLILIKLSFIRNLLPNVIHSIRKILWVHLGVWVVEEVTSYTHVTLRSHLLAFGRHRHRLCSAPLEGVPTMQCRECSLFRIWLLKCSFKLNFTHLWPQTQFYSRPLNVGTDTQSVLAQGRGLVIGIYPPE